MVITCENHDPLVQTQLMQLMEENLQFKDPLLYITDLQYFPYYIMKRK